MRYFLVVAFFLLAYPSPEAFCYEISSYAFVNNDGSIRIKGRTFRLYGVYIPVTQNVCQRFTMPVECASQAKIALEFKIGPHFVRCRAVEVYEDGSNGAFCDVEGNDLGVYMIDQGWGLALPNAPIEYALVERIARNRGLGVWAVPGINIYQFPP